MRGARQSNRDVDLYVTLRSSLEWMRWFDQLMAATNRPMHSVLEQAVYLYSMAHGSPAGPPPPRIPGRVTCAYGDDAAGAVGAASTLARAQCASASDVGVAE